VTRGDLKTGRTGSRTPFQIVADYYQTGDTRDRDLWREYGRATRGLASVRWSHGLRRAVLGSSAEPQPTDKDLAAENTDGHLTVSIVCGLWTRIRLAGLDHAILVASEIGGKAAATAIIRSSCLTWDPQRQIPT
jgi:hypothetical protein